VTTLETLTGTSIIWHTNGEKPDKLLGFHVKSNWVKSLQVIPSFTNFM